jgi:alpha-1,6-mannosyltransferase
MALPVQKSIVAQFTMLFLLVLYVCGFVAYIVIVPIRKASTMPFLWISSIHTLLGLTCVVLLQKRTMNWKFCLLLFLVPRLLVSPMIPWLSDDALRYIWDGNVLLHSFNPYVFAPSAPELVSFRAFDVELFSMLDYTHVTSIYPPLAQYAFTISVWLGRCINTHWLSAYYFWKILLIASEGIGLVCVYATLKHLNKPIILLTTYLFIPLPVIEVAGQAHLDGLLCAPLGVLLYMLVQKKRSVDSGISKKYFSQHTISASIGGLCAILGVIKILPAIVVIPILRYAGAKARFIIIAAFVGTSSFLVLPLLHDVAVIDHFAALARTNALYWQFNGAPYYVLCYAAAWLKIHEYWLWMPVVFSYLRSIVILTIASASNVTNEALFKAILASLCAILLFSPKVHTWYFVPLLFVNIIVGWKWLPVLASGSILSYAYYSVYPAKEQYGIEIFVWGIALLVGLWEYRTHLAMRRTAQALPKNSSSSAK